ncbi:hypothetical protein HOT49_gp196 [Erwinia phage vB_EamM_Alexandra]|uniref:Uncharacterized protein n=1 Tax=Erwinia phage vB_EamM_Alexandra TaxID=2201424 RepID=A0A2Z4QEF9_9CAUD|nr:hypothetical protein HOT49_gp196 [Erwinia phage vB_EamM_Alexandra]AWY08463.1 hypothetical protein Alexandra_198 [Erwinia phage vB_EamM_Alexandra]
MALIKINLAGAVESVSAKKEDAMYAVKGTQLLVSKRVSGNFEEATKCLRSAKKYITSHISQAQKLPAMKTKLEGMAKGSDARKSYKAKYDVAKAKVAMLKSSALNFMTRARDEMNANAGLSSIVLPFTSADVKALDLKAISKNAIGTYSVRGGTKFMKPKFVKWAEVAAANGVKPEVIAAKTKRRKMASEVQGKKRTVPPKKRMPRP